MPWTKRDVIQEAYAELGLFSYSFDLDPESLQAGLRRLDALMATWGGASGVRLGYSGGDGFGDIDAGATVPDWAFRAMFLNLAIELAPGLGKSVSMETKANAANAMTAVRSRTTPVATRNIGGGYAGAGSYRGVYDGNLPMPAENLTTPVDGYTILKG